MTQRVKINDRYKGIFYIILAAFGFAFMNLFVKLAGDLPAIEKSFFRNLVAIFFAFLAMKNPGNTSSSVPFLERSGSLQTFMQSASCILRMRQCLINYLPFLPLSFPISC